jgi:heme-degrading monooxygenase HmoA
MIVMLFGTGINGCRPKAATDINVELWAFRLPMWVLSEPQEDSDGRPEPQDDPDSRPEPPEQILQQYCARARIEVEMTFDLPPGTDLDAYQNWATSAIASISGADGCRRCYATQNKLDSPTIKWTSVWKDLEQWTEFTAGATWQEILKTIRSKYTSATNTAIYAYKDNVWILPLPPLAEPVEDPDDRPEPPQQVIQYCEEVGVAVDLTFNLAPRTNPEAFNRWAAEKIYAMSTTEGCIKCRPYQNILDSPRVKWTSWWVDLKHWAKYTDSDEWKEILDELSKY